jgi:GrpB-like predicted nucleotidyltransferase (UPF0157 family)
MRRDPIEILPYDEQWPHAFETQRVRVSEALRRPVEHIGSTAVPGLPAKPIIDMLSCVAPIAETKPPCPGRAEDLVMRSPVT